MTAREKFQVGDRVRLTALAKKPQHDITLRPGRGAHGEPVETGTVVGFLRALRERGGDSRPYLVKIQPDGYSTPKTFHMDFWERMGEEQP